MKKIIKNEKIYSRYTGAIKSLKNTTVVLLLPGLLFAIENYTDWLGTSEFAVKLAPVLGFFAYMIKNKYEFDKKNKQ